MLQKKKKKNNATEKEREIATDMRLQCFETFSDTNKRKDSCSSKSTKRKSRSWDDTLAYLRQKMEIESKLKERELKIAEQKENTMRKLLEQQQQQQNETMLALLTSQKNCYLIKSKSDFSKFCYIYFSLRCHFIEVCILPTYFSIIRGFGLFFIDDLHTHSLVIVQIFIFICFLYSMQKLFA